MKKIVRTLACALCAIMMAVPLGCNSVGGGRGHDKDTLTITVSNLGFGTNWLREIAKSFESAYNVTVKINSTVITSQLLSQLENNYPMDDLCFFAGVSAAWSTMRKGKFEVIDDIWAATVEGEDVPISEKTLPVWKEAYNFNGHYYSLPFISETMGLAYNKTTLNKLLGNDWALPRTSLELEALCARIKAAGAYAFTWSNKENACYWNGVTNTWIAQYDGADNFIHNSMGQYYDESSDEWKLDMDPLEDGHILSRKGTLRACQAADIFVKQDSPTVGGYSHQYATSMEFMESQRAFAGNGYTSDKKLVAFTPSGSWLYEESYEDITETLQEVGMMKVPVISAFVEKLSFYNSGDYNALSADQKVSYDEALVAIIEYIDGGKQGAAPTSVGGHVITADDISSVEAARGVQYVKDQAHAFIPTTGQNKDLAREFLKFFCSDYAGAIYSRSTHGFSPFYLKVTDDNKDYLNSFDLEIADLFKSSNIIYSPSKYGFWVNYGAVENNLFTGAGTYGTPQKMYEGIYQAQSTQWQSKLQSAGLLSEN